MWLRVGGKEKRMGEKLFYTVLGQRNNGGENREESNEKPRRGLILSVEDYRGKF